MLFHNSIKTAILGFEFSVHKLLMDILTSRVDCCLSLQNDGNDAHICRHRCPYFDGINLQAPAVLMTSNCRHRQCRWRQFAGTGSVDGVNLQAPAVLMASICRHRQF